MNSDALKYSGKDCPFTNKPYRKPKRKRRRNKYKVTNSRLRRRYHKRFQSTNKLDYSNSLRSSLSQFADSFRLGGRKIMSNWYWSNYKKALEWQEKHKVAHWRACALALQEENKYLLHIINSMRPGLCPNLPVTFQNLNKKVNLNKIETKVADVEVENNEDENEEEGSDEIEFEMSEEMMQFFEQSFKHKMELQEMKRQKQQLNDTEEEVKQIQTSRLKRSSEMQSLYGDQASMITGMETAVQLSYEKYCDTKSPKYWPNIPFRLS